MNNCLKILLLVLLPAFSEAQQKVFDSLHSILKTSANDTIRMDVYKNLGMQYDDVNLDSAVYYDEKGIAIARRLRLKLDEAEMITNMSWPLGKMGNYPRSLKMLNQALEIASNPESEENTWHLLYGKTPHTYRVTVLGYIHMGFDNLYGYTGSYEKQIAEGFEAVKNAMLFNDSSRLALVYPDIGYAYFKLNKLDSAIYFQELALICYSALSVTDKKYSGECYLNLGEIYQKKGDTDLAKQNFQKAILVSEQQNNRAKKGEAQLQLSRLYQSLKKTDSSLVHAKKGLETFSLLGKEKSKAIALRMISDYYSELGNADSSFAYLKYATSLNDSLDKTEKEKLREFQVAGFEETLKLQELENEKTQTQNKIRTYAMLMGLGVFLVIGLILYRNNRQKQKANKVLETTLTHLKATQSQLIQSEKMASLGELTAGIAHEIQNPLNFVNNFSEVNKELLTELNEEIDKGNFKEVKTIAADITENEEKISHHGKRADSIVKGMLQHSRNNSGEKELTDINALAEEYLRLAYQGLRAKDKTFNTQFNTSFDPDLGKINIVPQDIGRVLLNLYNNAFYAVKEKQKTETEEYQPMVSVSTKKNGNQILITVKDNGNGIPQKIADKIFQPFFTTKPTGQGTGLGLSLSYDIIKAHGGDIKVSSSDGEGSEFLITVNANS